MIIVRAGTGEQLAGKFPHKMNYELTSPSFLNPCSKIIDSLSNERRYDMYNVLNILEYILLATPSKQILQTNMCKDRMPQAKSRIGCRPCPP